MLEKSATLEERMTPEERELFERFKQQIGKEFLIEECLPQDSDGAMIRLMAKELIIGVWTSGVKRDLMSRLQPTV